MQSRRSFFGALFGAPAAAAVPPREAAPATATFGSTCECGYEFRRREARDESGEVRGTFLECCNPQCRYYATAWLPPRIPLTRAHVHLVAMADAADRREAEEAAARMALRLRMEAECKERYGVHRYGMSIRVKSLKD